VPTQDTSRGCLALSTAVVTGAGGGAILWKLADAARKYCGSYATEHSLDLGRTLEPLAAIGCGIGIGVAGYGVATVISRKGPQRLIIMALFLIVGLGLMVWGHFAWVGTPVGGVSDSGTCPQTNVPDWWPQWLPA
jgi:hypothetical protein